MPVKALSKVSIARNGIGAFVLPCRRITLQYCNWGGSSQGMRDFLTQRLSKIAQQYPEIEFKVVRKSGHPILRGDYSNDKDKVVCVRNFNIDVVENKLKLLVNSTGSQLKKHKQNVESLNESVRGIWSPLHAHAESRYKI
ncbi:hypothetical protein PACTADRAFT_80723 [Pachysolen tannophilus NRRL Y-2460]|uniref:Large ribosomal subunit protein mL43 n=1 Tax=Pachysolen tannophilus NRRL Y-2460 TaxID=669874 RepID=A0A1E4TUH5_PACTA|nr:hypothetical protein PACTADRAFT_80723 [Pachysolen tannophilus NRRL Y-2460]